MTIVQTLTVPCGHPGAEPVRGSFRIERRTLIVRHEATGRDKSIRLSGSAADPETLAQLMLLAIDDVQRGRGDP